MVITPVGNTVFGREISPIRCDGRKGLDCHDAILAGLLDSMPFQTDDRAFFIDVLPNESLAIKCGK